MFDRSHLPPALLEFVVMADTHYMLDLDDDETVEEFPSRRMQTDRTGRALALAAALEPPFMVHLGDLVQEYPGTQHFERAFADAKKQIEEHNLRVHYVAGNHDVGDKPDPIIRPSRRISAAALEGFHEFYGPSWYSFDEGGLHFVVVNSSLLNSELREAEEQERWLESDLAANQHQRTFMFLHHPPFLCYHDEPGIGAYDNISAPGRSWLLSLVRSNGVELIFAGHSHFGMFDHIDQTRYFVAQSTAFVRSGFSEAFSSPPPREEGRDDSDKLGFYLVRVHEDDVRVHLIRTSGETAPLADAQLGRQIITGTPRDLPGSRIGVSAQHPITQVFGLPIAHPNVARQPFRNDYPLLAGMELGAGHLRIPGTDLSDPAQARRLRILRDEGIELTCTWLLSDGREVFDQLTRHRDLLSTVEVQLAGQLFPDGGCLELLSRTKQELGLSVSLCPVVNDMHIAGKQMPRTRMGYWVSEVDVLAECLEAASASVDRVVCRIDAGGTPWHACADLAKRPFSDHIGAVDLLAGLPVAASEAHTAYAAEAVFAAAALKECRVFLGPLIDLDRTMEVAYGLLDRLCNPRPAFHAARCLNTVLFGSPVEWRMGACQTVGGARVLELTAEEEACWLVIPMSVQTGAIIGGLDGWLRRLAGDDNSLQLLRLGEGRSEVVDFNGQTGWSGGKDGYDLMLVTARTRRE